jgi:hypothetical protein
MVDEAIVGGIGLGMYDLAQHHMNERANGRESTVSPEEVMARGLEGVGLGIRELRDKLSEMASRFGGLAAEPLDERYSSIGKDMMREVAASVARFDEA